MMSFSLCLTLLVAVVLALSHAHIGGYSTYQDVEPQYYCGRRLARAIAMVCYDDLPNEKRSQVTMYHPLLPSNYDAGAARNGPQWPRIPLQQAKTLSARSKRFIGHGIVNECCDNPCSVEELLSYCG